MTHVYCKEMGVATDVFFSWGWQKWSEEVDIAIAMMDDLECV